MLPIQGLWELYKISMFSYNVSNINMQVNIHTLQTPLLLVTHRLHPTAQKQRATPCLLHTFPDMH